MPGTEEGLIADQITNSVYSNLKKIVDQKIIEKKDNMLYVEKPSGYEIENGIRSKERVVDLAEVFTPSWLVDEMLDSIPSNSITPDSRTLEPSCGNGNFLVEIVARKLQQIEIVKDSTSNYFQIFKCLASTYGIDISSTNILEARGRISDLIEGFIKRYKLEQDSSIYLSSLNYVIEKNIVNADYLKGADSVEIYEFTYPKLFYVSRRIFSLLELYEINSEDYVFPRPSIVLPTVYFKEIN